MKIFNYHGHDITFRNGNGDVMVNATQMAKPFGKYPKDWFVNKSTHGFMEALRKARGIPLSKQSDFVKIQNGVGTWMHEDVALEFARWLNPSFAIWCNDRIKELMSHGITATPQALDEMINNPDLVIGLASKLKEERAAKEIAEHRLQLANSTIKNRPPRWLTMTRYLHQPLPSPALPSPKNLDTQAPTPCIGS